MKLSNYVAKGLVWFVLLCFSMGAKADNIISVSSVQGAPGDEVSVSISLQNSDAVSSLQVSIPLDGNLTLVEGSGQLGSRCSGHSLTVGVKDGVLQVFVYSMDMAAISGNSGEVASFRLKMGNQPATCSLTPSKTVLTNTSGTSVDASAQAGYATIYCAKAEYSRMEVDFGRVPIRSTYTETVTVTNIGNADLVISSLDFSDINVFSTTTAMPLTVSPGASSDLNITYAPVSRGNIQRSLKVECNSISKLNTIKLKAQPFAVNELHVQDVSGISDEEVTVSMAMNNMDDISGYHVEFTMPDQLEYVDGSFAISGRKQDHTSVVSCIDNVLRIIVYSSNDLPFTGNDGVIGSFRVKLVGRNGVELTPSKAVLSATIDNMVDNVVSAVYGGMVNISSPQISTDSSLDFGAVSVTDAAERSFAISNYGSAPLTVSRIVFNDENLSVKEALPLTVDAGSSTNVTVVYGSVEQTAFEARMQIYSNDPDQRLQEVRVTGSRFAPNYFTISTSDVAEEENLSVGIDVNTYDAISGIQFDLVYPGQYYEAFDGNVILEERATGMTVTARQIDSNTLRYFCYFISTSALAPGSGKVMTIQLKPKGETVPEGNYTVSVKDIKLGTSEMADKYAGTDSESYFRVYKEEPVTVTAKSYTIAYGDNLPTFDYESTGEELVGIPKITCEATTTSPVGTYDIVITKGTVTNHKDTYVNGTLTITKAPLKIKAGTYTRKQGEENPEFTLSYEGFKNGETEEVLTQKPTATTTAEKGSPVGEYPVTASGAEAQNYEISYEDGTLIVTEADPVILTAKSYTRVYGEDNPDFEYETSGAELVGVPEITCEAGATSPVGTYDIIVSKGSVANYNDTYIKGTLTITKAPLKIKAGTYTRKQGEDDPEFTLSYEGFKNGETEEVLTQKPTATTTAEKGSPVGEYPVTVSGAEAQNYEISYEDGTLTVTEADPVTVTAKSYTRVYGEDNPDFEYESSGAELVGVPDITCEATTTSPVGTYDIIASKGSVANYNDTYIKGTLTITKAPLKIKAGTYTRKQGEENPEFALSYEGFKNGETEDVLVHKPTATTTAVKDSPLGDYTVTVAGAEALNYDISYEDGTLTVTEADPVTVTAKSYTRAYGDANPSFEYETSGAELVGIPDISCEATATSPVGTYDIIVSKGSVANYNDTYIKGTLTITKAPLKVKAGSYTRKQGEDNPVFTLTYEGFKNNETEDVLTQKPTATTTAVKDSPLGDYAVTVSGAEAQNYEISYEDGTLTVTEADAIILTAKSYTRAYGDANPSFEYETSGAELVGYPEITCEANATSPVGTYDILISKGSVANYNDTYIKGTLTIIKAPLKVKAGTYSRKQGEDDPEFTLSYEGFKNGETEEVLTQKPTATTTALKESPVGEYPVTASGAEAQNYEISYEDGTLIVTETDPVILTAKSYTRVYGEANPVFEYETSGAELVGIPVITCEANATSPVGTYDILISKGSVANYNDTYIKGTLTITKAPLKIKAGTYTRKQGEDNPEFTLSYEGFKNGETEEVLSKKPTATTTAEKGSPLGDYTVTVSGAEAQNYEITYEDGTLTVTEADPVTVTAKSYTRAYGETNPSFGYESSGAELVGIPQITCEADVTSPVGTYDILISKGSVANYNDTYIKGTLTITKAPLKVKAGTYTRKQGEEDPEFTLSYEGFKNGETEEVLTQKPTATTTAEKGSPVGEYTVTASGAEAQNYEISYEDGTLIVTEADPVIVTAKSYTRVYGEDNPDFEYETSGTELVGVPDISCEATATSPVGTYDIIVSKGNVANYNDTYIKGTLTITKAPLKIIAGTYTRKQGEENPEFTLSYEGFKNGETEEVLTQKPTATTTATKDSPIGNYAVKVSGAEAENYEINYEFGVLTVTVLDGDANGDGVVSMADVDAVVSYIYGNPPDNFVFEAADVNEDGNITVADVVHIINIVRKNNGE